MSSRRRYCIAVTLIVVMYGIHAQGDYIAPYAKSRSGLFLGLPNLPLTSSRSKYVIRVDNWFYMDGHLSVDRDFNIWAYDLRKWQWDVGDGTEVWEDPFIPRANTNDPEDFDADGICRHKYTTPGFYNVSLEVTDTDYDDSDGAVGDHTDEDPNVMPYQVIAFDLDIAVADYVGINDDDDDEDGVIDYDDGYDKDGTPGNADDVNLDENDLAAVDLSFSPSTSLGRVKLSIDSSAWDCVKIWNDPRKGKNNLLIPRDNETGPEKWCCYWYDPSALPSSVWLEVETMPIYGGVPLRLQYQVAPDGGDNIDVPSGEAADLTTVVAMYLTADELGRTLPDPCEETCGAFVHFNVDNDNESDNSVEAPKHPGADYANDENPVAGEDDLLSLSLTMSPLDLEEGVVVLTNNSSGELWTSTSKGTTDPLLASYHSLSWDLSDGQDRSEFALFLNSSKYVEGASATDDGEIIFRYHPPGGSMVHRDRVKYTYVAADCGNQPTTSGSPSQRDVLEQVKSLKRCEWSITGNATQAYNCIAWSVDETNTWYNEWDIDSNPAWGDNDGVFEDSDMDGFYAAKKGWSLITGGSDEERAERAEAMYYSYGQNWNYILYPNNCPSTGYHAARRRTCSGGSGKWIMYESKCGRFERIKYVWDQLNSYYGDPDRFYE